MKTFAILLLCWTSLFAEIDKAREITNNQFLAVELDIIIDILNVMEVSGVAWIMEPRRDKMQN